MARILVLSDLWLPFPGGAERLVFNVSRDLARAGHDVHVLTDYAYAQQFDGPPIEHKIIEHVSHDEGWQMIADTIDEFKPDVLLTHHFFAFHFEAELVACGVPLVQLVLNGHRIPEAALAVYITEYVRDQMQTQPQDLVLMPPALDDVIAEEHGDLIGFIKPIPHKGVETLYAIATWLHDRRFLVLRGEWQDIEILSDLPNVEYMEPVADIRDFYRRVRLLLVPSVSEDAGTVAQEATLNSLPCLSSNVGGLVETNAGGVQLLSSDVPAWVAAIVQLDDEGRYGDVVESQRRHAEEYDYPGRLRRLTDRIGALCSS